MSGIDDFVCPAILEEAHSVIAGQTKSSIPDIPDNLKNEIIQRRTSDVLI